MVKGTYQLSPRTPMELLHSNIWWSDGLELIKNNFSYSKAHDLYCKSIQCVDNTWDSEHRHFLSWDKVQEEFNLTPIEAD